MSDGLDSLGFRIRWKRKRGTGKWCVYTFIADRSVRTLKGEDTCPDAQNIAVGPRVGTDAAGSGHAGLGHILQARRGQAHLQQAGLLHVLAARTHAEGTSRLELGTTPPPPHHHDGKWRIAADGAEFFRIEKVTVSRYTYRGNKIPSPWPTSNPA